MAKKKNLVRVFDVTILHADGTITHLPRLTLKGLFLLVKVEDSDLVTVLESVA